MAGALNAKIRSALVKSLHTSSAASLKFFSSRILPEQKISQLSWILHSPE